MTNGKANDSANILLLCAYSDYSVNLVYSVFYSVYSVLFNIFYSACVAYSVLLVSNDYSVLLTLCYSVSVFNFNSMFSII